MNPTVVLVRHGATAYNGEKGKERFRSWLDIPLSDEGKAQARHAATAVNKAFDIKEVVASDLKRTTDTAHAIASKAGLKAKSVRGLRDWNVGDFSGKPVTDARIEQINKYEDNPDINVPGGESFGTFRDRIIETMRAAMSRAASQPEKGAIVLVTHNRSIRALLAWHKDGMGKSFARDVLHQEDDPVDPGGHVALVKEGGEWNWKGLRA